MHILGGVDKLPGQRFIEDTDIYALDETKLAIFRRRQIGLIYQFYNLIPVLSVKENITLPLLLDGRKPDRDQLERIISTLGCPIGWIIYRISFLAASSKECPLEEHLSVILPSCLPTSLPGIWTVKTVLKL